MAATFSSRSNPPVASAPAGATRDSHFSWVMPDRLGSVYQGHWSGSLESLSESAQSHSSSSVSSSDGSPVVSLAHRINLRHHHKDVLTATAMAPQILNADANPPLRGRTLKDRLVHHKSAPTAKSGNKERTSPSSAGKSLVPSAFKFKRTKSGPISTSADAHGAILGRAPSARSSLPIAARFAKANRASWIQKYGSIDATTGPIVPSSKPTLSFVNDLPGMAGMPLMPVRSPLAQNPLSPVMQPSTPLNGDETSHKRRNSPYLRAMSPSPDDDIPATLHTPAAVRIMYPSVRSASTMPPPVNHSPGLFDVEQVQVPNGNANVVSPSPRSTSPVSRLPQLPRTTTVVQLSRVNSPSPVSRSVSPQQSTSSASPPAQLVTSKRMTPTAVQNESNSMSNHRSSSRSQSPGAISDSEGSAVADKPFRRFIPAPPANSGLRRTPSLPPARRAETPELQATVKRGREHPFPLRPVHRRPVAYGGSVTDDEEDAKLARVGFYLPAASLSATDLASYSLRPPAIISHISEARSSVCSDTQDGEKRITLMTEEEHDARREKLINRIERLIMNDGRI